VAVLKEILIKVYSEDSPVSKIILSLQNDKV